MFTIYIMFSETQQQSQQQDPSINNHKLKDDLETKFNEILKFIQSQESIENRVLKLIDDILAEKQRSGDEIPAVDDHAPKTVLNSLDYIM
jgi:tRNA 2-selenouridine synthase SelU